MHISLPMLKCILFERAGIVDMAGFSVPIEEQTFFNKRNEAKILENRQALDQFLAGVEKRAFRMAELAVGNPDQAMDIVQDAMLALVKNYSHKNETDWGPLFHRILQSKIRDWYRRSRTRNSVFGWLYSASNDDGNEAADPIQQAPDLDAISPDSSANNEHLMDVTLNAIRQLPLRQQQAFLLRAWEGLDVKETARAMGVSQGSVKTHYSRASKSLRRSLGAYQA